MESSLWFEEDAKMRANLRVNKDMFQIARCPFQNKTNTHHCYALNSLSFLSLLLSYLILPLTLTGVFRSRSQIEEGWGAVSLHNLSRQLPRFNLNKGNQDHPVYRHFHSYCTVVDYVSLARNQTSQMVPKWVYTWFCFFKYFL